MNNQLKKAQCFHDLHQRDTAFVIPNPWDAGSARLLEALGFEALATTSSGFAQSLGRLDGSVTLDQKAEHCRSLAAVTNIPISVDLENGFAHEPAAVAHAIKVIADTGVVGASIEDYSGSEIYDFDLAVERIQAAVEAARNLDFPFTLTARAENLLRGVDDMDETIRRLQTFAEAGADVLFAPGLKTIDEVREVTQSLDKPVNVLAPFVPGATVDDLEKAGAQRISVGGALANVAIGALLKAGNEIKESGSFNWLQDMASRADLVEMLGRD